MSEQSQSFMNQEVELATYPKLAAWLEKIVKFCLFASVVSIPLFFLPITLDVLELNKQTLLIILSGLGVLAWIGQALCERKLSVSRSWLHLVVLAFALGYVLTGFFSEDRYLSLVGNFGQMQWAFASIIAFVVFYFLVVNTVKSTTALYNLIIAFLISSIVVGVLGLVHFAGWFPLGWFGAFGQAKSFNTIGTINSLGVYMVLPLILSASLTVLGCKDKVCILGSEGKRSLASKILVWSSLAISIMVAVAVDYWVVWAAILFGTTLLVVISMIRLRHVDHQLQVVIPAVLVVLSVILLLFRTPINFQLPNEVSPSFSASWDIARKTLQDKPLFGSGPGTWIYDYSKYRQAAVNQTQFWNIRFERGVSSFLTLMAMIGLIGIGFWLMLVVSGIVKSVTHLARERNDDAWQAYLTVFTAWATLVFISFFYNFNFSHHFAFWLFFGLLAALVSRGSLTWDAKKSVIGSAGLSLTFLFVCVGMISVVWLSGQRLIADAKFSKAISSYRQGKPIQDSIANLQSAVGLNKWNDAYYRNLSQAFLIRASSEMQLPAGNERTQKVNDSVTLAINWAEKATKISAANVDNWANFAVILQSISNVYIGADDKAIEILKLASDREPNNPAFITEVGKIHILRSDKNRQLSQSQDQKVRAEAEQKVKMELDLAAEELNRAIQLKPDYAPAHYSLGLVYERQGRIRDAVEKLETVLRSDKKNVGIGFQLAILYYRDGEKDKALDLFEQIVAFDPNYSNARWYLSAIYEERGRYQDALMQAKKVLDLNPGNKTVEDKIAALTAQNYIETKPPSLPEPVPEVITGETEQNQFTN